MLELRREVWNQSTYVKLLHCLHKSPGRTRSLLSWIIELEALEVFAGVIGTDASGSLVDLLDEVLINLAVNDILHHGEMFEVVVSLEQSVSSEELN